MLKTLLIIVIFITAMTILGVLVPQQITDSINNAFVYFLTQINSLRTISPTIMSAVFSCMQILATYLLVVVPTFFGIRWLLNITSG